MNQPKKKEKKDDRRVKYSKMVIKDSFIQLLKEKPITKITIKEICALADINRATFYAHYTDTYPESGAPQDGVYIVSEAHVTIGANTLSLPFPAFPAVLRGCGSRPSPEPTRHHEPTVTPTATLKPES